VNIERFLCRSLFFSAGPRAAAQPTQLHHTSSNTTHQHTLPSMMRIIFALLLLLLLSHAPLSDGECSLLHTAYNVPRALFSSSSSSSRLVLQLSLESNYVHWTSITLLFFAAPTTSLCYCNVGGGDTTRDVSQRHCGRPSSPLFFGRPLHARDFHHTQNARTHTYARTP
jgi:hypothetical protein